MSDQEKTPEQDAAGGQPAQSQSPAGAGPAAAQQQAGWSVSPQGAASATPSPVPPAGAAPTVTDPTRPMPVAPSGWPPASTAAPTGAAALGGAAATQADSDQTTPTPSGRPPAGQQAPPGYWPPQWPTPLGSAYGYSAGPTAPVPPPQTAATATSWWRKPAVFVTALVLSFLLGMGSFALGSQVWSAVSPQPEAGSQGRTPSGSGGTYPGFPGGQAPSDQGQSGNQEPDESDVQPRSAVQPTEAQTRGVVLIEASSGNSVGAGTGMVLSADGMVLTNYHVVAGSEQVQVTLADTGDTYSATVVGFDQSRDVALLQLEDAGNLPTVAIDDDPLAVGDAVSAVGNASGGGELVRADGTVTGVDQDLTVSSDSPWGAEEDLTGLIQTDADAVPGDSGGPMFDAEAEVTGMTTAGSVREGDSYAIPIADALAVVQVIEAGKDSGTVRVGPAGYLGIVVADASQSRRGSSGARVVTQVVDGSPADSAGITEGSVLESVNGTEITSETNLADVIRVLEPGQKITVEWTSPDGEEKSAEVTLEASPIN